MMVWLTDGIVCSDTPPGQTEAKAGKDQKLNASSTKASGLKTRLSFCNTRDENLIIQTVSFLVVLTDSTASTTSLLPSTSLVFKVNEVLLFRISAGL
jgi:hypothetical protein